MAAAINIVGHGTDGSDGIARGIHLRWAFDDKLGFPDCIRLFRRESDLRDRYVLEPPGDEAVKKLKLPYKQRAQGRKAITFTIEYFRDGKKLSSVPTTRITLDNATLYLQPHDGEVRITLSRPVPRIILGFILRPDTAFAVEVEGARPYQPLHMGAGKNVPETLEIEGDAIKRIRLIGEQIVLVGLTAWDCVADNGNSWQEIKLNCGCGLPVEIKKPTNYIGDAYNQIKNLDFATVLCRLGIGQTEKAPFTAAAFDEFRQTLRAIEREGSSVPVGWTRFPSDADGRSAASDVGLKLAQYDYLLVQSQLAATARALDLAYLDDQVDAAKVYDYRVETSWPDDHKRRLDHILTFEDQEPGQALPAVVPYRDELAIGGMVDGRFEALDHPGARSTRALTFDCTAGLTGIQFVQPVTEVQIWLAHGEEGSSAEITVSAFAPNFITAFETISVTRERQFLRIEAPAIAAIRFAGARVAISRLHYDREPFPHGSQSAQTCGLRIRNQHPLETPRDLQVAALPGGPVMVEGRGRAAEKPQLAGLRWAAGTDHRLAMLSIHPVAYHIEREDRAGRITRLTEGKPLLLGLDVAGAQTRPLPQGWPGRPYYVDPAGKDQQDYRVAALDIFGRLSAFSAPVTYTPQPAALATPRNARARYLDPAAYDAASDQLLDPLLTAADRDWLRDDGRPAIRVTWSWPAEIPAPQRDAENFQIVFQEGWLNVNRGMVDAAVGVNAATIAQATLAITTADAQRLPILATLPAAVPVLLFRARLERTVAAGDLRFAWLKQGPKAFLVLANGAGRDVEMRVLAMTPPADAVVEPGQGFAVTLTADSAAFADYALAPSWTDRRVTATIRRRRAGQVDYEHLIPAPRFPDPPIGVDDLETIRYGQLGVYATRGPTEGAVSVPATVMAVRRQAPQAATLPYDGGTALRASPADIHGKARFALRWPKLGSNTQPPRLSGDGREPVRSRSRSRRDRRPRRDVAQCAAGAGEPAGLRRRLHPAHPAAPGRGRSRLSPIASPCPRSSWRNRPTSPIRHRCCISMRASMAAAATATSTGSRRSIPAGLRARWVRRPRRSRSRAPPCHQRRC